MEQKKKKKKTKDIRRHTYKLPTASDLLMSIIRMLHVVRIRDRSLMNMLRPRRIRFTEAEFDEHVLVIALILLRRMHAVVHEIVTVLVVILHRAIISATVIGIRPYAVAKG